MGCTEINSKWLAIMDGDLTSQMIDGVEVFPILLDLIDDKKPLSGRGYAL